ncbi:Arabinanase/levansucrase/invertase [Serendipita vermifera]|nr:Arabinanase/levansucrase/invertase [Serendipita vermifera]
MLLSYPVRLLVSVLLATRSTLASGEGGLVFHHARQATNNTCNTNQDQPPGDLTQCGNSTLFQVWRPKARFIAPEGWMNDPQGLFQRSDGSFHAGYQCNPQHISWGNISQCSAFSNDLTVWRDANSWQDPKTLYPSQIYDIRGVFDGSIITNGYNGLPTTIYTSVFPGPLGATSQPPEVQGVETQSLAYTPDGGATWIKLPFGPGGNPVISEWPVNNLTGFRDPYAFESPMLSKMLTNVTAANGPIFLTLSGGIRAEADPSGNGGSRLFLYRQTTPGNFVSWTYLGPLVSTKGKVSFSAWSGNFGTNFETAGVTRLNERGMAYDDGSDERALNIIGIGTEQGRPEGHENHWPLWAAATYHNAGTGIETSLDAVGVVDWGRVYASIFFPVSGNRSVLVGWTYEDDESLVLTRQRGYQGAFTLFRDLFLKVTRNVDPNSSSLRDPTSWKVWNEADGSVSVATVGQRIVPETLSAYRSNSTVSSPPTSTLNASSGYVPFPTQPTSRFYAINANLQFNGNDVNTLPRAGFRVLASDQEYTDIWYDVANETLIIQRDHSSLITACTCNGTEYGKLRLWNIVSPGGGTTRQSLNFTIVVDNSVVEVYANDVTVITTRVYPWLSASKGCGFLATPGLGGSGGNASVTYTNVELWDGLINAWPERPANGTVKPLLWDGPLPDTAWHVWSGI